MTTYNIKINEHSNKAKYLLSLIKEIAKGDNDIEIELSRDSDYDKDFISKIKQSQKESKLGKSVALDIDDLWK